MFNRKSFWREMSICDRLFAFVVCAAIVWAVGFWSKLFFKWELNTVQHQVLAAWVQAVGSVAALIAVWWQVRHAAHQAAIDRNRDRVEAINMAAMTMQHVTMEWSGITVNLTQPFARIFATLYQKQDPVAELKNRLERIPLDAPRDGRSVALILDALKWLSIGQAYVQQISTLLLEGQPITREQILQESGDLQTRLEVIVSELFDRMFLHAEEIGYDAAFENPPVRKMFG